MSLGDFLWAARRKKSFIEILQVRKLSKKTVREIEERRLSEKEEIVIETER